MGFHVGLDSDSAKLVKLITTDPSKVLGKLYSAYLLFLVTEPDKFELQWLLDNAKALDSLTGNDIAYAVFAQRFKLTLRTDKYHEHEDRKPKNVGKLILGNNTHAVRRLVKDGAFGMVMGGDALTAITYGTDMVARHLRIIDKLPCMVIIDAIPTPELCIIRLDEHLMSSLMNLLRKSIAEFSVDGGNKKVKSWSKQIVHLQDMIVIENSRAERIKKEIGIKAFRISQLKKAIVSGAAEDSPHVREVLEKFITDHKALTDELEILPQIRDKQLSKIDRRLESLIIEYNSHAKLHFSTIFRKQVKALGLTTKLAAGKTSAMSFLGSLFKPETLVKVFGLMHS